MLDPEVRVELLNLHDAYMNANLVWYAMQNSPLQAANPNQFLTSNRARFERLWWALVAVYLESWASGRMAQVRQYVARVVEIEDLNELVRTTRRQPLKKKLRDARGYMFHRDQRAYQDVGRFAPLEHFQFINGLHIAFGRMMIAAMSARFPIQTDTGVREI